MKERLKKEFQEIFQIPAERVFFSPGRVNLIGEHIDNNGGIVLPCAITYGTYGAAAKRKDRKICFYSDNFKDKGVIQADLDGLEYTEKDDWANYAKGVIFFMQQAGCRIPCGLDILIAGNIPNGAGLSSSASLEVLIGTMINDMFGLGRTPLEIVQLSKKAENEFIGVNCGIMDQFIIGMGKKDHAVALNTATLEYDYIPVHLKGSCIVIMNTNKRRGLADSKYNERLQESQTAFNRLKQSLEIQHLCDLEPADFEKYAGLIKDPVHRRRARHAVMENARVKAAVEALRQGDIQRFGQLMNASHMSLRDDYEVTGKELDTLVESAWKQPGVLGARMTGAGFGGCAIALVEEDKVDTFVEHVNNEYTDAIGYAPDFYKASIGSGAKRLDD